MEIREIHSFEFDTMSETLSVQFSIKGDGDDTYRNISLDIDNIVDNITNPSILEEYEMEDIFDDEDIVIEILENFFYENEEDLPSEEIL